MDRDQLLALGEMPQDVDRVLARLESDDTPPPEPMRFAPGELTGETGE